MAFVAIFILILQNNLLCYGEKSYIPYRNGLGEADLGESFFPPLFNAQINATQVLESTYRWMARVVLSRTGFIPFMCNAVCIQPRIFITAARCIVGISIQYTRVIYNNIHLPSLVHITSAQPTKQYFDDIALIVTENMNVYISWHVIHLFDKANRTDDGFQWFADLKLAGPMRHKIVAYAPKKPSNKFQTQTNATEFALYELGVIIGIKMCKNIYTMNNRIAGYFVPCCLQCTIREYESSHPNCDRYIGVEGAAIINVQSNTLIGLATWGPHHQRKMLPVGFSVPNSENFWTNYKCALLIKENSNSDKVLGYYEKLCNKIPENYYYFLLYLRKYR